MPQALPHGRFQLLGQRPLSRAATRRNEAAQYGVDPRLIAPAAMPEPVEHIGIEPQRHQFLRLRHDNARAREPVRVGQEGIGVGGDGAPDGGVANAAPSLNAGLVLRRALARRPRDRVSAHSILPFLR